MKRNYDAIPISFEEAAEIDGASVWQSFSRILLPLGMPALAMHGLFSLLRGLNESVIGAILLGNPGISALRVVAEQMFRRLASVSLPSRSCAHPWGPDLSSSADSSLPVCVLSGERLRRTSRPTSEL